MMKRLALLLSLCLTSAAWADHQGTCPSEPPAAGSLVIFFMSCGGQSGCPHGVPVQMKLVDAPFPVQPPFPPRYQLQSCDTVTWDFGDGSPPQQVTGGSPDVQHTWSAPGNYLIEATVTNALGSTTFSMPRVVSSQPSWIEWPVLPAISETQPNVSIPVRRTGSTAHRVSATLNAWSPAYQPEPAIAPVSVPLVFEPGQTEHLVTLPLHDNKLFDGRRGANLFLGDAAGGAFLKNGWMEILDDEPQPTLVCDDVRIPEGDSGRTRVRIPCRLSAPLGTYLNLHGALWSRTATDDDYHWNSSGTQIVSGQLTGTVEFDVFGDTEIERDEQLQFTNGPYGLGGRAWEPLSGPPATITIVNDEAVLTPPRHRAGVGDRLELTLHPGRYFDAPASIALRASDPSVLRIPASLAVAPGQDAIPFTVELLAEGRSRVEVELDGRVIAADIDVHAWRTVVAGAKSLVVANGGKTTVTFSMSPPQSVPIGLHLTGDPKVVALPPFVTIPAGGEATVEIRGTGVGHTSIGASSPADGVVGTAVLVDVVPARKQRAVR